MANLAIVPARGGSKRLPGKNIKLLAGKPLIHYTLEAALESGCFERVLFSSDSDEYLEVAGRLEGVTLDKRPASLAGDTIKVIDAVCEIAEREEIKSEFDTITLLLPTCPFRRASDIRKGLELLDKEVDAVVSITQIDFPITMGMSLAEPDNMIDYLFDPSPLVTGDTRSQDHKPAYRPNGGFYMAWADSLRKQGNYFRGKTRGYVLPQELSADIDTDFDFKYAEFLLSEKVVNLDD